MKRNTVCIKALDGHVGGNSEIAQYQACKSAGGKRRYQRLALSYTDKAI